MLSAKAVARAANDGYTLLLTTNSTHSVVYGAVQERPLRSHQGFHADRPDRQFASYIGVTPDKPYQSIKALVDYAKANPGKLSYGVGNSTSQIVREALKKRTGADIVRVPYRSNPMVMTDLLGGQVQIMVADFNTGIPQLNAGKVNALAVLTRDRHPSLPNVPTLNETVMPGYHILAWAGLFGPAGMPPEVVKTWPTPCTRRSITRRCANASPTPAPTCTGATRRVRRFRQIGAGQLDGHGQGGGHPAGMREPRELPH